MPQKYYRYFLGSDDPTEKPIEFKDGLSLGENVSFEFSSTRFYAKVIRKAGDALVNGLRFDEVVLTPGSTLELQGRKYYFYFRSYEELQLLHVFHYIKKHAWQPLLLFSFIFLTLSLYDQVLRFRFKTRQALIKKGAAITKPIPKKFDYLDPLFIKAQNAYLGGVVFLKLNRVNRSFEDMFDAYLLRDHLPEHLRKDLMKGLGDIFSKSEKSYRNALLLMDSHLLQNEYQKAQEVYCQADFLRPTLNREKRMLFDVFDYKTKYYPDRLQKLHYQGFLKTDKCLSKKLDSNPTRTNKSS